MTENWEHRYYIFFKWKKNDSESVEKLLNS